MTRKIGTGILLVAGGICVLIGFVHNQFFILAGAITVLCASALQFPFREEESWECSCGYDLSYLHKTSSLCPECGKQTNLEWTAQPGEFARKTVHRLYLTVILFIISVMLSLLFAGLRFSNL
jgi:hypothetical protein